MKVQIRKNGPVIEAPDEAAKKNVDAGLWFPVEKKAEPKPVTAELPTNRKTR